MGKIIKIFCSASAAAAFIIFSENVAQSIVKSIEICITDIIPSMFAMMTISTYIASEGIYLPLFRPLYSLLGKIFRMDRYTFSVFFLSLIGGYPVGIKLLKERIAQNKNYSAIAEKAASFCYCISPPFAITMIGIGVYKSIEAGIIVYLSNIFACIITAVIMGRKDTDDICEPALKNGKGILGAVNSASSALFTICTLLIAWNAGICIIKMAAEKVSIVIPPIILSFAEISNLLSMSSPTVNTLPLAAAAASFGGLCVITQCKAICGSAFSLKLFYIFRLINSALSAIICYTITLLYDISIPASTSSGVYQYTFSPQKGTWLLILLMAILFFSKNEKIFKKG